MNDKYITYTAETPARAHVLLKADDLQKGGKIKNGRAFNIHFYLTEEQIQKTITTHRKKIRSYGYILHDKDVNEETGELNVPHYHLVIRTYSAFTRFQIFKWFQPYLFDYDAEKNQWEKKENISIEFPADLKASTEYLTHQNHPEKYQYPKENIVSDDWEDLSLINDKSKDDGIEIINAIIEGVSEFELCKRYGKEYIYHKKSYRDCAISIMYEENQQLQSIDFQTTQPIFREEQARKLHEIRTILSGNDYYFNDSN